MGLENSEEKDERVLTSGNKMEKFEHLSQRICCGHILASARIILS